MNIREEIERHEERLGHLKRLEAIEEERLQLKAKLANKEEEAARIRQALGGLGVGMASTKSKRSTKMTRKGRPREGTQIDTVLRLLERRGKLTAQEAAESGEVGIERSKLGQILSLLAKSYPHLVKKKGRGSYEAISPAPDPDPAPVAPPEDTEVQPNTLTLEETEEDEEEGRQRQALLEALDSWPGGASATDLAMESDLTEDQVAELARALRLKTRLANGEILYLPGKVV